VVSKDMTGPNGIAFSPDEKYLYVGNWDDHKKVIYRYLVQQNGTLSNGMVFFDTTKAPGEDAIDGMKVDVQGNLYISGPGGIWVVSAQGKHLGTIITPMHAHNMAWGGEDHQTLYLTAKTGLYRIHLNVKGAGIPN
jgi:gluconolactonase